MEKILINESSYIKNLYLSAWGEFKKNWRVFIAILFTISLAITTVNYLIDATIGLTTSAIGYLISYVIVSYFGIGRVAVNLKQIDTQKVSWSDLFLLVNVKKFALYIATNILSFLIIFGATFAVFVSIIVGLILLSALALNPLTLILATILVLAVIGFATFASSFLMFTVYSILDQSKGIWSGLMHSLKITKGYRRKVFLYALFPTVLVIVAILMVNIPVVGSVLAGVLLVALSLFIVLVQSLATARLYRELQTIYESKSESTVIRLEKVFSIISLVIAPLALFVTVSVLTVIGSYVEQMIQLSEQSNAITQQKLELESDVQSIGDISAEMLNNDLSL